MENGTLPAPGLLSSTSVGVHNQGMICKSITSRKITLDDLLRLIS